MQIRVDQVDLTDAEADVIVTAANPCVAIGGGVAGDESPTTEPHLLASIRPITPASNSDGRVLQLFTQRGGAPLTTLPPTF